MITITNSSNTEELEGILELQKQNLKKDLTPEQIKEQGFVTVSHSLEDLEKMHQYVSNIIAKDGERVVAYVLAMTEQSKNDIPRLVEMYESFDHIMYQGKPVSDYHYLVVGQVCIGQDYRGRGLFDQCYHAYKDYFKGEYDFAITEIASINLRSMNAHKRVGFEVIYTYTDSSGVEWNVVVWDWKDFN
ncbi:RimJ/RimL family protein N-acetyltransferase [Pedobacter sp. AK013]|uniref:GNAT family N-acetyltransferase n=1 Tax=Pedobacter sp. AK013 TaxID=2723071 RepID=UPI0016221E17|nr:GNAT family N-acetyltransferase [Pedobacter sp. AK013]MBB6237140.1 RimJ/RimL family protein N-acetyltransferase [Pedobacter sp. AK013]